MTQVNIFKAKTDLSKLIMSLETKEQDQIIIARAGKPVAVLLPYSGSKKKRELGKYDGKYDIPDDFDEFNDEILDLLGGL